MTHHDDQFEAVLAQANEMLEDAQVHARNFVAQQDEALGWGGALLAEWLSQREEYSKVLMRGQIAILEESLGRGKSRVSQDDAG